MSNYFKHKIRTKSPATIAGWVILGIAAAIGFFILFGYIVMWLWNGLVPEIFNLPEVTYWQAVGLLILFKIFFGGFGGGGGGKGHKKKHHKKEHKNDFSKWEMYEQFWEEEGDDAFRAYKAKKEGNTTVDADFTDVTDEDNKIE